MRLGRRSWCAIYAFLGVAVLLITVCTLSPDEPVMYGAGAAGAGIFIGVAVPLLAGHRLSTTPAQLFFLLIGILSVIGLALVLTGGGGLDPGYQMGLVSILSAVLSAAGGAAAGHIASTDKEATDQKEDPLPSFRDEEDSESFGST